jgi:hypothetical protein
MYHARVGIAHLRPRRVVGCKIKADAHHDRARERRAGEAGGRRLWAVARAWVSSTGLLHTGTGDWCTHSA